MDWIIIIAIGAVLIGSLISVFAWPNVIEPLIEYMFLWPMYILSAPAVIMILAVDGVLPWHENFIQEYKVMSGFVE